MDLRHVFDCMISVSELGRGQASKVIQAIEETGNPYIVIKNNKPHAVILSIQEYMDLLRSRDLLTAMESYTPLPREDLTAPIAISSLTHNLTHEELGLFLDDEEGD
ncbi:MAG: type II toxin-antitoxin system Phd/YefM family antitoxin [Peptococcaceae bacterium]|nr:type II toxin-antitoxin system Phd/YefM family antitoxin [Peptococcaceae bacterium]